MSSGIASLRPRRELLSFEGIIAWSGAAALLVAAVLWADHGPSREKTDFSVTYLGARIMSEGHGGQLYDLGEQQRVKAVLLKNAEPLIYEHPPFEALVLLPLGVLPYKSAYLIWGLLNALVWLSLPILLRPYAPMPRDDLGYLCLWILFAPLGITLYQGQSSLFLLLLYTLAFISLKTGDDFRAGLWLGLGLFKFQLVVPLVLIFLVRRKWRLITAFTITATALTLLSLIAVGWRGIIGYARLLFNIVAHPNSISYGAARDMATLHGLIQAVFGRIFNPAVITLMTAILSAALIVWVARRWRSEERSAGEIHFNLMFATSIVISLVISVHLFTHDLSPLILAALLVLPVLKKAGFLSQIVLWPSLVLLWTPVYFLFVKWHCMYLFAMVLLTFAAAMLLRKPSGLHVRQPKQFADTVLSGTGGHNNP